jgi:hypothetical protein
LFTHVSKNTAHCLPWESTNTSTFLMLEAQKVPGLHRRGRDP